MLPTELRTLRDSFIYGSISLEDTGQVKDWMGLACDHHDIQLINFILNEYKIED